MRQKLLIFEKILEICLMCGFYSVSLRTSHIYFFSMNFYWFLYLDINYADEVNGKMLTLTSRKNRIESSIYCFETVQAFCATGQKKNNCQNIHDGKKKTTKFVLFQFQNWFNFDMIALNTLTHLYIYIITSVLIVAMQLYTIICCFILKARLVYNNE